MASDLGRIQRRHWTLVPLSAFVLGTLTTVGAGGVLLGGGMMGLSVAVYDALYRLVVQGGRRRLAIGLLFAKVAAFVGMGWLAFASERVRVDPLGFAIGVTCFPLAVVWTAAWRRES